MKIIVTSIALRRDDHLGGQKFAEDYMTPGLFSYVIDEGTPINYRMEVEQLVEILTSRSDVRHLGIVVHKSDPNFLDRVLLLACAARRIITSLSPVLVTMPKVTHEMVRQRMETLDVNGLSVYGYKDFLALA